MICEGGVPDFKVHVYVRRKKDPNGTPCKTARPPQGDVAEQQQHSKAFVAINKATL